MIRMRNNITIFGLSIEGRGLDRMRGELRSHIRPYWIVTVNPEILLEARCDPSYKKILEQADERCVDGFGVWALLRLFGIQTSRVSGVDVAEALVQDAMAQELRIGFYGGASGEAQDAEVAFKARYPQACIYSESGGLVDRNGVENIEGESARDRMSQFDPHVLLVALGHPKQERWIARYIQEFPSLRIVIGVGGTLSYWSRRVPRAPRLMRVVGLEWFYRLLREPWRFGRVFRAVVLFPIMFVWERYRIDKA